MKKHIVMDCETLMDTVYEAEKESVLPVLVQVRMWLHQLSCPACEAELKALRNVEEIMKTDFIPPSPNLSGVLMERIYEETTANEAVDAPAGFSLRGWIIVGFFVLLSLCSIFFGTNFIHIANVEDWSFLLPVGITIGVVITCYGAFFVGSHLKELSSRFGLR
jgi:hypothetical protein